MHFREKGAREATYRGILKRDISETKARRFRMYFLKDTVALKHRQRVSLAMRSNF